MKQDQNLRFVIIGMGYLMEYIAPCYSKLLGDKKGRADAGRYRRAAGCAD